MDGSVDTHHLIKQSLYVVFLDLLSGLLDRLAWVLRRENRWPKCRVNCLTVVKTAEEQGDNLNYLKYLTQTSDLNFRSKCRKEKKKKRVVNC